MNCPNINNFQSVAKGNARLNNAIDHLGKDVVEKILCFAFYHIGFPLDFISQMFSVSEPGVKLLIKEIYANGIDRFLDKRKKNSYPVAVKAVTETFKKQPTTVSYNTNDPDSITISTSGPLNLTLNHNDKLTLKLLILTLFNANYLKAKNAIEILNCNKQTFYNNLYKFRSDGSKALIDNRAGQQKDYKYDKDIKSEIIKIFFLNILSDTIPTQTTVCEHINSEMDVNCSKRSIAYHLNKMGLIENKEEIISEVATCVNKKVDSLDYLELYHHYNATETNPHRELLRTIKEQVIEISKGENIHSKNIVFDIEKKTEKLQAQLQPVFFKSFLAESLHDITAQLQCSQCNSHTITIKSSVPKKSLSVTTPPIALTSGMKISLPESISIVCTTCDNEISLHKEILQFSPSTKFTPLTQKKICSANRAGSYETAAKLLKELTNLEINRNQVRCVSNYVGRYIYEEFQQLYSDISQNMLPSDIQQRHPLIENLSIENEYLDSSNYFIVLAVDGGRMQLFDWIPRTWNQSAQKILRWCEPKIFRISIYDRSKLQKVTGPTSNDKYQSASIVPHSSTYGATNGNWKDAAKLIHAHIYMRGIKLENVELCISDGSEHIMNTIFAPLFPNATHILDYYHKAEALHSCLKEVNGQEERKGEVANFLWNGQINKVIDELKLFQEIIGIPSGKRIPEDPKVKIDNLIKHFDSNKEKLLYDRFRLLKYPIGSGCIESAVKLFGKRVKGTEKQWNTEGGEAILQLYSFLISEDERWNKLWEVQRPWV